MKRRGAVAVMLAALGLASIASAAGAGSTSVATFRAINCNGPLKIALVTPLTGGAAFLGNQQLSWAKYAVKTLAPRLRLKIRLLAGDIPVEQGPQPAQALAKKYVADPNLVGVIGPATFGAVTASSDRYFDAGIAHISPSATRTALTKGTPREATPAFFRVVSGDYLQAPSEARFLIDRLHVKKVVVLDFQEPYSVDLADMLDAALKKEAVSTIRLTVAVHATTDFSALVTEVPDDADIVFFPTQKPTDAQRFAQLLLLSGKKAKVFGGDRSNNPAQFNVAGSYVANFAPDIMGIAASKPIIAGWRKDNPGTAVGLFGPPAYGAVEVLLRAIKWACVAGNGQIGHRRDVVAHVKRVTVKNWILGGSFRWSTKSNDPLNARFSIFQIQSNGSYKLVG